MSCVFSSALDCGNKLHIQTSNGVTEFFFYPLVGPLYHQIHNIVASILPVSCIHLKRISFCLTDWALLIDAAAHRLTDKKRGNIIFLLVSYGKYRILKF